MKGKKLTSLGNMKNDRVEGREGWDETLLLWERWMSNELSGKGGRDPHGIEKEG